MLAARITSGVYSLGESTILLRQSLDMESAIPLSTPAMNSTLNENSDKAISHRTIIGLELCEINSKLRLSVKIVNLRSRKRDFKYEHEKNIVYASFYITDQRSLVFDKDLLIKATGISLP